MAGVPAPGVATGVCAESFPRLPVRRESVQLRQPTELLAGGGDDVAENLSRG